MLSWGRKDGGPACSWSSLALHRKESGCTCMLLEVSRDSLFCQKGGSCSQMKRNALWRCISGECALKAHGMFHSTAEVVLSPFSGHWNAPRDYLEFHPHLSFGPAWQGRDETVVLASFSHTSSAPVSVHARCSLLKLSTHDLVFKWWYLKPARWLNGRGGQAWLPEFHARNYTAENWLLHVVLWPPFTAMVRFSPDSHTYFFKMLIHKLKKKKDNNLS